MTDSFLEEIAEAAEDGHPVPDLKLITASGDWISGTPCSSERFRDRSHEKWMDSAAATEGRGSEAFASFGAETDDFDVLNLEAAFLAFGGRGDGLHLGVVSIPIANVTSWWIGSEGYEAPRSKTSWGAGLILPVGS